MVEKTFVIKSINGLSSRASSSLVSNANRFKCDINLYCDDEMANLKSIINVLGLMIKHQDSIKITCNGEDEEMALKSLEILMQKNELI